MADKQDLAPVKIRLKDNYRERIFAESQQLGKSYLETWRRFTLSLIAILFS